MTLSDEELLALVLLCVLQISRRGCEADPTVTSAMAKLQEERQRRAREPSLKTT